MNSPTICPECGRQLYYHEFRAASMEPYSKEPNHRQCADCLQPPEAHADQHIHWGDLPENEQ